MASSSLICQLLLTVASQQEANAIADSLLDKQLVTCVKQVAINSRFRWQGKIENANEILLIMESREDLFDRVEAEVAKLHSYDTFVLEAVAVSKVSAKARGWVKDELDGE